MTQIICEENGQGHDNDVVTIDNDDDLFFPHVDSCLAIIFVRLKPQRIVGGHAALYSKGGEVEFEKSLNEMLGRMETALGGTAGPDLAIFIGDIAENDMNCWPVTKAFNGKPKFFKKTQSKIYVQHNPFDLWYDTGTFGIKIADWNSNHDGKVLVEEFIYTARQKSHAGGCCIIC